MCLNPDLFWYIYIDTFKGKAMQPLFYRKWQTEISFYCILFVMLVNMGNLKQLRLNPNYVRNDNKVLMCGHLINMEKSWRHKVK